MKGVFVHILVLLGICMPFGFLAFDEPGDSLPNWITSTVEVKTYRVINPGGDSLFLSRYQTADLGRALSQTGMVHVFQYGPNGTACLMRSKGLAPDHTEVLWNNVSLNSITLGQTDLSLIPMFFLDQIGVSSPGFYLLNANGGIGGTLNVASDFKKTDRNRFWYQSEYSSIHNNWNGLGCQIVQQDKKRLPVVIQLRAFSSNNLNQFQYRNPYASSEQWVHQDNNNSHSRGLQLHWSKWFQNGHLRGQFWTIDRTSQLPSIMGVQSKMRQSQWDNQNRGTLYFVRNASGHIQNWKSGLVVLADRQTYWMMPGMGLAFNDTSRIQSNQTLIFSELEWKKLSGLLWTRAEWREARVMINGVHQSAHLPQWMATWNQQFSNWFFFNAATKWAKGPESLWNKSALGNISILRTGRCFKQLKLQGQWIERAPDFNELYWPQSGNPHLKSEQSFGSALNGTFEYQKDIKHRLRLEANLENRQVFNWIQWVPQSNGLWRPFNIQRVESWHAEARVLLVYQWRNAQIQWLPYAEWNWVEGRQLDQPKERFAMPYVPEWKVSHQLDVQWNQWTCGWSQRWMSARFTDQSNAISTQLPAVLLSNLFLSRSFSWKNKVLNGQIKCENLMNVQYQEVRSYAIPGRVISVQFGYQIN